jgi:hypothetical protein
MTKEKKGWGCDSSGRAPAQQVQGSESKYGQKGREGEGRENGKALLRYNWHAIQLTHLVYKSVVFGTLSILLIVVTHKILIT